MTPMNMINFVARCTRFADAPVRDPEEQTAFLLLLEGLVRTEPGPIVDAIVDDSLPVCYRALARLASYPGLAAANETSHRQVLLWTARICERLADPAYVHNLTAFLRSA